MTAESKQQIRETSLELMSAGTITHLIHPFTQKAMFWRPDYLEISAWIEHIPFAFWLVEAHHPSVFVELGTHYGVSYFAFCQAVEKLELNTRCFAVDTWKGDEHAGVYDERVFEKVKAYNESQYSGFSRLVRSTFDDALSHFSDASIDLLHIDGLHTFEAVRHDFESWLPKLSERAVVVMHDTNVHERKFGVFKLFESLRERYSAFEFIHGHGLGVLKVGPRQTDQMLRLFRSAEKEQAKYAVHEAFARLGLACADSFSAAQQKMRAHKLKEQVDKQKKQLEDAEQNFKKNKTDLHKRTKELTDIRIQMQTQIEQHAVERGQLDERVRLLQEIRTELKQEIAGLKGHMDVTSTELSHREEKLTLPERVSIEHQQQVREAGEELRRQKRAIASLQETDDEKRAEIKSLEVRLAKAQQELAAAQQAQDADNTRHKNDMSNSEAEVARLTEVLSILQQELVLSQSELGKRNEIIERLQEKIATQAAEMEGLQQDLESRTEEIGRERWYLGERDAEIRRLTDTLAAREQELDRAQSSLYERNEAVDRLQQTLDEHLAEAQTLNVVLAEKSDENEGLTRRLAKRKSVLIDTREALQVRDEDVAQLKQQIEGRSKELIAVGKKLAGAIEKQHASAEELSELEIELQALRQQLEVSNCEKNRLEKEVKIGEQDLGEARASINVRFDELATLTKMLEMKDDELAEKERVVAAHEGQVKKLTAELAGQADILKTANDEKETLTRQVEEKNIALQKRETAIEKQRQRVIRLKATVSWKITAPVRALARPFIRSSKFNDPIKKEIELIKQSDLFDRTWYLNQYPDVAENNEDPAEHYYYHGASEGRDPGPNFNTAWYLEAYKNVADTEGNPLVQYLKHGKQEGYQHTAA